MAQHKLEIQRENFLLDLGGGIANTRLTHPELFYKWLGNLGHTGSFPNRLASYALANGIPASLALTLAGLAPGLSAPTAPVIGTATAGGSQASVTFSAPSSDGGSAITGYTVTSSPGGFTATGTGSPLVVMGLTNGVAYTFTVTATNAIGTSVASAASNSVTPVLTNLLTKSQQFDDAIWLKSASTVTANTAVAPDGTTTAETLTTTATSDYHFVRQGIATTVGSVRTHSIHAKRNNNDWIWFTPHNSGAITWFNLATGLFGTVGANTTATVDVLANGWYRIKLAIPSTEGTVQASMGLSNANNVSTYAAAGTEAVYLWGGQLNAGATATAYEPIA